MSDICANRHRHNPQSEEANQRVEPVKLGQRERVFRCIQASQQRGVTTEEMVEILKIKVQSVSARVSELKKEKRVYVSGTRNHYGILWVSGQLRMFE